MPASQPDHLPPMASSAPRLGQWGVLLAVGVGTFMSALDSSVVNTVLPVIRQELHSQVAAVQWVITIYLLTVSGLLLSFGRLGDLQGHRRVYVSGFALFVLSSALCGLSSSVGMLVACRGLQACGAAMLFANSPAILTSHFPLAQRGRALGLQATMTYLGLTVGPSLGGFLADQLGWRSVFYINVPVGALALGLSLAFIPHDRPREHSERFDLLGAVTFASGLVLLLVALNRGSYWGWASAATLGTVVAALALLAAFVAIERRVPNPMLDLSLFRRRIFATAAASAVLNYICLNGILFLLPFYLIQGRGLTSSQSGLILTAQPIVMAVTAPLSGALSDRIGSRLLSALGMLVLAIGALSLARMDASSPLSLATLGLLIVGFGIGIFVSPNNSSLMGAAPRQRQGIAGAVLAVARNVGMVLGVGLAGALYNSIAGSSGAENTPALYRAAHVSFLVSAGVAVLGSIVAASRPTRDEPPMP